MNVNTQPRLVMGGFKELISLFFPIALTTFSTCLFYLVEKVLLARLSVPAMEAAVNATYVSQIFQAPNVALVMMSQVFVGRWCGAKDWKMVGPGMWQFIWFSFFSLFITIPAGIWFGGVYFHGMDIENIIYPYYHSLLGMSFLYLLGSALSCFFIGQSKTRFVLFATVGSQIVKLILGYLLIFGYEGWIPSFGLMGGIVSTLIAQGGFCAVLFAAFLKPHNVEIFHTHLWRFQPKLFWECTHPGFLRLLNRILAFGSWTAIAHMMAIKGGEYLLVLSIGGALFLFLPFLGEALCQAQVTVMSHILGAKRYDLVIKASNSAMRLVFITVAIVSIPLVVCPVMTFRYLFPDIILDESKIRLVLLGIWSCWTFFTFAHIPLSYILACKDTKFYFYMGFIGWVNGYLVMYIALEAFHITAHQFWLALAIMHGSAALFYYLRMKWLHNRISDPNLCPV